MVRQVNCLTFMISNLLAFDRSQQIVNYSLHARSMKDRRLAYMMHVYNVSCRDHA